MKYNKSKYFKYDINSEPIILSKITTDILLKCPNPSNCISLYIFYYYTAKWQKTNQPMATTGYVQKGLKWGLSKVQKTKKQLKQIGLIEDIKQIDPDTKKIKGWYIKINFIWSKENADKLIQKTTPLETTGVDQKTTPSKSHPLESRGGNALSTNNINALSTNNKKNTKKKISPFKFFMEYLPKEFIKNKDTKESIKNFIQFRKKEKKNPLTERSIKIICNKFQKYTPMDLKNSIDDSIMSGWSGVFPPKNGNIYPSKKNSTSTGCQIKIDNTPDYVFD